MTKIPIKTKDFFPEQSQLERAVDEGLSIDVVNRFNRYTDDTLVGKWWEAFPVPKPGEFVAVKVKSDPNKYGPMIEAIELFKRGKIDFEETKKRMGWIK